MSLLLVGVNEELVSRGVVLSPFGDAAIAAISVACLVFGAVLLTRRPAHGDRA